MSQQKTFILDTNVLLHDPQSMFQFADNIVVIPIIVLEEIDQFKKELSDRGRSAREVCRRLDELRKKGHRLAEGVTLPSGGTLRVVLGAHQAPAVLRNSHSADNMILGVALEAAKDSASRVILVTKDVNLRIRADALGLIAEDYDVEQISIEELYSGHLELLVSGAAIASFYQDGKITLEALRAQTENFPSQAFNNEYVLLRNREGGSQTALGRLDFAQGVLHPIRKLREGCWGIRPRNKEQHFALDLLLNDDIKLVSLVGKAGTGKTLLAIAAGLQKVAEEKVFHKLLVSRPIFPLGRDIGYLPGTVEEKLNPWMQPIYDNVEFLLGLSGTNGKERRHAQSHQDLVDMGFLAIEPLTYIRGRSIPNQYMIVDEAQNLTPHEIKTIITRAGEGTKIIFTGDIQQIDHPYLDSLSNGLSYLINRMVGQPLYAHVTLEKGERSELAELASNLL